MSDSDSAPKLSVGATDDHGDFGDNLRADAIASLVVFLVALPLCIGIAVAVGVSPAKAIITGIIGGIVVGFFAGSPLQATGPSPGIFVIVADQIMKHRASYMTGVEGYAAMLPEAQAAVDAAATEHACMMLGAALLIAGTIQMAAGRFSLGQWFRAVSPAVIHGMLTGIGVLIVVSQLHVMLDHDATYDGHKAQNGWQYAFGLWDAAYKTLFFTGDKHHHLAAIIGCVSILVILLWQRLAPASLKLIPGALLAVIAATFLAWFLEFGVENLKVPANLFGEITWPGAVTFQGFLDPDVVMGGIVIAIVASAETLLCAAAVDQMHSGKRTDFDQELTAQGVGNFVCGLLGCLPLSGVIVRSSANVQAGAKTRWSTIMHGVWLLLFVIALPFALGFVPKACLGAILVYTGLKLIDWEKIRDLWKLDRGEAAIFFVTMTLVVVENLLVGVVVGITLSAAKLLYTFTHLDVELSWQPNTTRSTLKLSGAATFVRLPVLAKWLEQVPPGTDLTVDLSHLHYIDHACLELLTNWETQHVTTGGSLNIDWNSLHARFRKPAEVGAESGSEKSEVDQTEAVYAALSHGAHERGVKNGNGTH